MFIFPTARNPGRAFRKATYSEQPLQPLLVTTIRLSGEGYSINWGGFHD
jgi:hypothetical protein